MIVDVLDNARIYREIHPHLAQGFEFLAKTDLAGLEQGKHVLDGERLFAMVQEYPGLADELGKYESHRKYWDLQYIVRGVERIGVGQMPRMKVTAEYDPAKDIAFYEGTGDIITLRAGMFAVFGPQDVHMPGLATKDGPIIRKVVVKILWSE